MRATKQRIAPFLVYLVLFHTFWMWGYVFWVYPWMKTLGDTTFRYALVNISIRFCVWVLPVILYLRHIDHRSPVEYLKLRQNWMKGIIVGLVLVMVIFLGTALRSGMPHPSMRSVTWNSILSTSLLIGFFEEIPYRGFILQKFEERFGFWIANLLSSLLFLSVHLPGWISLHLLTAENVISVFIFGSVLAVVFRYCKSLWGPIVVHSLNDFISFVIFHQ